MSIPNDFLAKAVIYENIVNTDSAKPAQTSFNILFDIKSMANFYAIGSSFSLACYYSKKYENLTIKDSISQPVDDLAPKQKWEIISYVRSKER